MVSLETFLPLLKEKQHEKGDNMSKRMVAKKLEVCSDLGVVEKAVAMAVLEKRHNLAKLKKLKDYVTMKRCTFRDEQLKKLIGD